MKLVEMKCKNCGANLKINSEDKDVKCIFCNTSFKIDDEIKHIKYDDMEQSGYEFEKGKIRAREEARQNKINEKNAILQAQYEEEKRKKNLKWWIVSWLFFFPIPLTILIWKSKWDQKMKIIVTAILWSVLLIIAALSSSNPTIAQTNINNGNTTKQVEKEIKVNETFIENYNTISQLKIENLVTYNAQDKESGYYRTEFRLNAFENNTSIHGTIGDSTVDLINYGSLSKKDKFRFYAGTNNEEQMKVIFKNAINIIDSSISSDEINEVINEAIKTKDNRFVLKSNVDGYIMFTKKKWEILINSGIKFVQ